MHHLVDPIGAEWFIPHRGLAKFVAEHLEMFAPKYREYVPGKSYRAAIYLNQVSTGTHGRRTHHHWQGWSRFGAPSIIEIKQFRKQEADKWRAKNWKEVVDRGSQNGKKLLGRACDGPTTKRGPGHHRAISFRFHSPDGYLFEGPNLSDFVRNNPDLFEPDDVVWKPQRPGGRDINCRAVRGLSSIRTGRVNTWKGWVYCA